MEPKPEFTVKRREWFVSAGRLTLLGGLSALSLHLWSRSSDDDCINNLSPCAACKLWQGCQLPKATASKVVTNHGTRLAQRQMRGTTND